MNVDFIKGKRYTASVLEIKYFGIFASVFKDGYYHSCLIPKGNCLERTNDIEIGENINVVFITQPDEDEKLPIFLEIFDYEQGDKIEFNYIEEFEKNGTGYRKLSDSKGRIITSRKKYWQSGSYKNKPNHNAIIEYTVIGFSDSYYPLLEEANTNHPFELDEFEEGQEIELFFEEEYLKDNIGHRKLIDSKRRRYDTKRSPWQRGPKYSPPNKGDAIKYIVEFITDDGYPICKELVPHNPYKFDKKDIPKNISYYFDLEPVEDEKLSLFSRMNADYENGNANWILSFTNLLKIYISDHLERKDFNKCLIICDGLTKINASLKTSGFLLSYRKEKRSEISNAIEYSLNKTDSIKLLCEIALSNQPINRIKNVLENILKSEPYNFTETDIFNINMFNLILSHLDEYLSTSDIKLIIDHISNNPDFFAHKTAHILYNKRKILRKKLFTNKDNINFDYLANNSELSFLIYLQNLETKRCEYYNDIPEVILSKAITNRFKAYHNPVNNDELINDSIEILKEKIQITSIYDDQNKIKQWFKRLNIELGMNYEYLAIKSDEISSITSYLGNSFEFYCKAKSARSYLITSLLDYYDLYKMFIENNKLSEITLASESYLEKLNKEKNKSLLIKYPLMENFIDLYKTFCCIGVSTEENNKFLFNISLKITSFNLSFIKIYKIASLILSHNLLSNISEEKIDFSNSIRSLFLEDTLNIKNIYFEDIEESEELLDIILSEESALIEFKGSFSLDLNRFCNTNELIIDKKLNNEILKTTVGMLNTTGGSLYIGILERDKFQKTQYEKNLKSIGSIFIKNRIIVGVEPELDKLNWNTDKHILHITDIFRGKIGKKFLSHINISQQTLKNRTIYQIDISPYHTENGVWLKTSESEIFYVRENNQTVKKSPQEAFEFLRMRNKVDKQLTLTPPDG